MRPLQFWNSLASVATPSISAGHLLICQCPSSPAFLSSPITFSRLVIELPSPHHADFPPRFQASFPKSACKAKSGPSKIKFQIMFNQFSPTVPPRLHVSDSESASNSSLSSLLGTHCHSFGAWGLLSRCFNLGRFRSVGHGFSSRPLSGKTSIVSSPAALAPSVLSILWICE